MTVTGRKQEDRVTRVPELPDMAKKLDNLLLGESEKRLMVRTAAEIRSATIAMARQSKQVVRILSHSLERKIYDDALLADALARLAVRHRQSRVLILLRDPSPAVTQGHRLVQLSQRLSSYIEVRRVSADYREQTEEFMIADDRGVIYRSFAERFEGTVNFDDRERMPELLGLFKEAWETASPETEFRRLHL